MRPSCTVATIQGTKNTRHAISKYVIAASPPNTAVVAVVTKKMDTKNVAVISQVPRIFGNALGTYSSDINVNGLSSVVGA